MLKLLQVTKLLPTIYENFKPLCQWKATHRDLVMGNV